MAPLVEIKFEQGVLRVILTGDITLVEASTVKKMVMQATESSLKPAGVVLDLSGAGHIYSPALGRLIGLKALPVPVVIVPSELHADLFAKLGLGNTFSLCETVADAVAFLRGEPHAVAGV